MKQLNFKLPKHEINEKNYPEDKCTCTYCMYAYYCYLDGLVNQAEETKVRNFLYPADHALGWTTTSEVTNFVEGRT